MENDHRIGRVLGALAGVAAIALTTALGCGSSGEIDGASCTDGRQNGSESAIDCGGSCPKCGDGQGCAEGADCKSGVCTNRTCRAPSCDDGLQNGDETSVDCGGSCATPEVCNGKDDDCNGKIDEDLGTITCGTGVCQVTVPACEGGVEGKCTPGTPGVEICDGMLDEDCDGVVDNGCDCAEGETGSCYTGAASTMGVGACHAGTQTCTENGWGPCEGEVVPEAESCNGADDDCNGQVDDGIAPITCGVGACQVTVAGCDNGQPATCTPGNPGTETCNGKDDDCNGQVDDGLAPITCGVGACQVTVAACAGGQPATCTPGMPSAEICDGADNDCDGVVDDGNPGGGVACSTGKMGVCAAGITACSGGTVVCNQSVQPSGEVCEGALDESCDGQVDEGCACVNGMTQACYTGPAGTLGKGICTAGVATCQNGAYGACIGQALPGAETCDGLDNDCDGVVDDGNPGGGTACNTGLLGVCSAGTTACSGGTIVCNQNVAAAPAEDCATAADDNCNGQVNEGCSGGVCTPFATQSCYSGPAGTQGIGVCKAGTQTCNASGTAWGPCTGQVTPGTESCKNATDDNCNGQVNEGCSALTCPNIYVEDFNDGVANALTAGGGAYQFDWCNSYVPNASNTPLCMLPGQTSRTNANGGINTYVGIWVSKSTASCSAVRLSYDWYQFASSGAVVEYKQTSDTFASSSSCNSGFGWTTAVPAASMSTLQTCSSTTNVNIPFGSSPAVYIKLKSTNAQNNAMWWDNIKLTLIGCDC